MTGDRRHVVHVGGVSRKPLPSRFGDGCHDGNTYRAVYTVRFPEIVYVLHVFQKRSKTGIQTPKHVIDLIRSRLKTAERDYRERRQGK